MGNERILFVDDEKGLIDIGKKQLESLGYRVMATQSSFEALQFLQRDPGGFDLIITDQTMPNMTGDVLAQKCLQIKPDIPIILCTGYSEKVSDEKVRELGIRAFIMKPVNRREIGETIRRVLDTGMPR